MLIIKLKNRIIITLFVFLLVSCSNLIAETIYKKVRLSWLPSISNDIAGYNIYIKEKEIDPFSKVSDTEPVLNSETGRIECVVSGLPCGFDYSFVATAYTSVGIESGISDEVKVDYLVDCQFDSMTGFGIVEK